MRAPRWEAAPRTPEERLLRAIACGPVIRFIRKPLLPLWLFAEDREDTLVGWLAMRIGDVIDVITARIALLPRVRFK